MNQRLKLQLAGYVDDGMDYSNSAEVRSIVDASDVAREFYERLLFANKRLESFFQSKGFFNSKIITSRWLVAKKDPTRTQSKDDSSGYIKEVMRSSN